MCTVFCLLPLIVVWCCFFLVLDKFFSFSHSTLRLDLSVVISILLLAKLLTCIDLFL